MRPIAGALVTCLIAVASYGSATRTYMVGVKPHHGRTAIANRVIAVDRASDRDAHRFRDFEHLDAFAADLTEDEAAAMRQQADVTFVEPSMRVYAFGVSATRAARSALTASTTATAGQLVPWGISALHAPDVWRIARGDDVNVAIVDTGIDYAHPDLRHQYAGGYNAIKLTNDPLDDHGHGTHVAGTIAAEDNAFGVVGAAPRARLWAVKALAPDEGGNASGSTIDIAAGIDWVVGKKGQVGGKWIINMSLGITICTKTITTKCTSTAPQAMLNACQKAADAGILIFAAAGNDSTDTDVAPVAYPAAFPSVVAVGAIDPQQNIAVFSNQGPEVALVAPGQTIKSAWLVGKGGDTQFSSANQAFDSVAMVGSPAGIASGQLVYCGLGKEASDFPTAVRGNIALIQRGDITFADKTKNAIAAGAIAVAIFNNKSGLFLGTLGSDPYPWPVTVSLSLEDGQKLTAAGSPAATIANAAGDYQYEDGTSMASPHAVAAAALVWSAVSSAEAKDVLQALTSTAHDLGAGGRDSTFGFGLVDPLAAVKNLAPKFFEPPTPTGRMILKRGRG